MRKIQKNNTKDNCLQQCVAVIFEQDLNNIPNFFDYNDIATYKEWHHMFNKMKRWAKENGYYTFVLYSAKNRQIKSVMEEVSSWDFYYIVIGQTYRQRKRGENCAHAVVHRAGKLKFDPNQKHQHKKDKKYGVVNVQEIIFFIPLYPKIKKREKSVSFEMDM